MPLVAPGGTLPQSAAALAHSSSGVSGCKAANKRWNHMKKQFELARRTCKLMQRSALYDSARLSSSEPPSRHSGWTRTSLSDVRATNCRAFHSPASSGGLKSWQQTLLNQREPGEQERSRNGASTSRRSQSRSSATVSRPAPKHAPDSPAVALSRSVFADPAHPSREYAAPAAAVLEVQFGAKQAQATPGNIGSATVMRSAPTAARSADHTAEEIAPNSLGGPNGLQPADIEHLAKLVCALSHTTFSALK